MNKKRIIIGILIGFGIYLVIAALAIGTGFPVLPGYLFAITLIILGGIGGYYSKKD